jgi:hypothetical protein
VISDVREGRFLCHKSQLEVIDDGVDNRIVDDKGDDAHLAPTLGADERPHLINLADYPGPASGGQRVNVFLDDGRTGWINSGVAPLAPVSIGVKQSLRTWKPAL